MQSFWESERQLSARVDIPKEDISNGVSGFIATVPLQTVMDYELLTGCERLTAWIKPLTEEIHGMATGVPDCITTTVDEFDAATAEISLSMWPGRDIFSLSAPSPSQSAWIY